eukprot:TRINITY_DN54355_c0_g1_i1.p1 TRINITY_DN54355_c0_g1~~TRINITY_DN54355_c0_g1_i1.p1  ORF type:complete len:523 (-),score=127.89 TRINITY_DN54355_c0_g1_i1:64-1632(-)
MKFAKKLEDERCAEWWDMYVDYKSMKKALKQEESAALFAFSDLLERQVVKVHDFMCGQQQVISNGIMPLRELQQDPKSLEGALTVLPQESSLTGQCAKLVQDIENFHDYASLNQLAIRKILKKFDKRFRTAVEQQWVTTPCKTRLRVNGGDVEKWMLHPARQCLRLLRSIVDAKRCCARQFCFWVAEVRQGAQLTGLRAAGVEQTDLTALRLQLCDVSGCGAQVSENDQSICIRNTFIHSSGSNASTLEKRRASSLPPRLADEDKAPAFTADARLASAASTPTASAALAGADADASPQAPAAAAREASARLAAAAPAEMDGPRVLHLASCSSVGASTAAAEAGASCGAFAGSFGGDSSWFAGHTEQPAAAPQPLRRSVGGNKRCGQSAAFDGPRWWTQLKYACPLTGFPLSLLPYPPFKLRAQVGGRSDMVFVDGLSLALQMIISLRFDFLGAPVSRAELDVLDAYIKRCKLGRYRVMRAWELATAGTVEGCQELFALQAEAQRRLNTIAKVQRFRREQHAS